MNQPKKMNYLKIELSCSPAGDYLPEYNNVTIEKEFELSEFFPFEYHLGKTLNALLNHHCGGFDNYTVFPYSITNEEKGFLLKELSEMRKENGENIE